MNNLLKSAGRFSTGHLRKILTLFCRSSFLSGKRVPFAGELRAHLSSPLYISRLADMSAHYPAQRAKFGSLRFYTPRDDTRVLSPPSLDYGYGVFRGRSVPYPQ